MKIILPLLLCPTLALAHPHQWIDLRITPQTDASGALIALRESWEFDPYSSEILLERNQDAAALAQFKKDIDQFFAEQHGFTYSQKLAFTAPRDTTIDTRGGILRYDYTLPLKTPARGTVQKTATTWTSPTPQTKQNNGTTAAALPSKRQTPLPKKKN